MIGSIGISNKPRKVAVFLAVRSEAFGTSRHFAATQQFGRYWSEADIQRAAPVKPNL
jgi:hypothetical protein